MSSPRTLRLSFDRRLPARGDQDGSDCVVSDRSRRPPMTARPEGRVSVRRRQTCLGSAACEAARGARPGRLQQGKSLVSRETTWVAGPSERQTCGVAPRRVSAGSCRPYSRKSSLSSVASSGDDGADRSGMERTHGARARPASGRRVRARRWWHPRGRWLAEIHPLCELAGAAAIA